MDKNNFELLCQGDSRILKINAQRGEQYIVEAGSMVAMTPVFDLNIKAGGLGKMLGRVVSGETLTLQEYKALDKGELLLAPTYSGDIMSVDVGQKQYRVSNGNFLACESTIELNTKAKVKGIFGSGEGIFTLTTSGEGKLFVNSCGSIYKIELSEKEEYVIDSGHLVLWDSNMEYKTELAGGKIGKSILSGEGFLSRFYGPGEIWIQTRKPIIPTTTV